MLVSILHAALCALVVNGVGTLRNRCRMSAWYVPTAPTQTPRWGQILAQNAMLGGMHVRRLMLAMSVLSGSIALAAPLNVWTVPLGSSLNEEVRQVVQLVPRGSIRLSQGCRTALRVALGSFKTPQDKVCARNVTLVTIHPNLGLRFVHTAQ